MGHDLALKNKFYAEILNHPFITWAEETREISDGKLSPIKEIFQN